jgi:hypothetical protein
MLALASSVARAGDGTSYAALVIGKDPQTIPIAVNVARMAREVVAVNPDLDNISLEQVLEGTEPVAWAKRKEAEAFRDKGRLATEALEFPVAADAYAQALVAYEQAVPGLTDLSGIVDVLLRGGAVLVSQGDKEAGVRNFDRALALDPAVRLPKQGNSARVLKVFDEALKARKSAGEGTLTVYATTGAAEVWIDGVFRGVAPLSLSVPVGRHYVRVLRDGYVAFGSGVDVKRGTESSVQASLRPTAQLAKLEAQVAKVTRNPESHTPVVELAAFLQVDRTMVVVVESEGASVLLTLIVVDAVANKELARASKAFAVKDSFFEHDVKLFLSERVQGGGIDAGASRTGTGSSGSSAAGGSSGGDASMLPGDPEAVETPGTVIAGWVMLGVSIVPIASTVTFGVLSWNYYGVYRNLPSQLDPNLQPLRNAWLATSIATDASAAVAIVLVGGGVAALVSGYAAQATQEEVLAP